MKPCPNIVAQVAARLASGQVPTSDISARAPELVQAARALVEESIKQCPADDAKPAKGSKAK